MRRERHDLAAEQAVMSQRLAILSRLPRLETSTNGAFEDYGRKRQYRWTHAPKADVRRRDDYEADLAAARLRPVHANGSQEASGSRSFPHAIVARTVDSLDDLAQIRFTEPEIDAITENIRGMHDLAVTKYDDIDPLLTPIVYERTQLEQTPEPRAPEIQVMYDQVPLRLDSTEFRVLDVLPGCRGSPIKCLLFTAMSMLEIEYEALSYVWGNSTEPKKYSIDVNNCSMPVTTNLHNALQSLRYPHKNRLIWIDAVCIDQVNDVEKITQLPMMGDIYRIAKRVCVYLGEADDESDFLLQVLEEHQDLQPPGTRAQEMPNWTATMGYLSANEDRIIHSLICLMHRKWFERLWIYQEFHVAARDPLVYIGSHSVSASVMFGSLFGFLSDVCALPSIWTSEKIQQVSHSLSHARAQKGEVPLELRFSELRRKVRLCTYAVHTNDLMPRYPCFWLADPAIAAANCWMEQDKIYGIVGMFDPISREILKPVKNMPHQVVFMRVTAWCLLVDNQIFYTYFRYHLLLDDKYPSWTLAFHKPIPFDELPNKIKVKQEKVFPDEDPLAKVCIVRHQVLYIEGVEFSKIEEVCPVLKLDEHEKLKKLWHFEQRLASRSTTNDPQTAPTVSSSAQHQILHWAFGFSGKLVSWLTRNNGFYELVLSGQFPTFPETEAYPSGDAMQELLGGLLFDPERLLKELYEACQLAATDCTSISSYGYGRLGKALFGVDIVENARVLRVVYDALENIVPSTFSEESSRLYLEQHGYSTIDARENAITLVAAVAAEGDVLDNDTALNYMYNQTYNFANLRDEYGQRLLNSTFVTTTNGQAGLGPEGAHGYQPGDKIVFFREMPTAMAIRRCEDDNDAFRFVGIVQMEGLLDGSIYKRPEIKEGKPRLFKIR